jgi:hypothetical protein
MADTLSTAVTVHWEIGPTPSIEDEKAMQKFLILNRNENTRGRDLSHGRREVIGSKGTEHGFTIQGAMSLRRQFIRMLAGPSFYSRNMGSETGAQDHSRRFEVLTASFLTSRGVQFVTEQQLRDRGHRSGSPDFLLSGNVLINGTAVSWIDCKTFYGSSLLIDSGKNGKFCAVNKLHQQASVYTTSFGPGAFLFLAGFSGDLQKRADLRNVLLLDATPFDVSGLFDIAELATTASAGTSRPYPSKIIHFILLNYRHYAHDQYWGNVQGRLRYLRRSRLSPHIVHSPHTPSR